MNSNFSQKFTKKGNPMSNKHLNDIYKTFLKENKKLVTQYIEDLDKSILALETCKNSSTYIVGTIEAHEEQFLKLIEKWNNALINIAQANISTRN